MHLSMSSPTPPLSGLHGVIMGELTSEFMPHVGAFDMHSACITVKSIGVVNRGFDNKRWPHNGGFDELINQIPMLAPIVPRGGRWGEVGHDINRCIKLKSCFFNLPILHMRINITANLIVKIPCGHLPWMQWWTENKHSITSGL